MVLSLAVGIISSFALVIVVALLPIRSVAPVGVPAIQPITVRIDAPTPEVGLGMIVEEIGSLVGDRIERSVIRDQGTMVARIKSLETAIPKPTRLPPMATAGIFRPCAIADEGEICEVPTAAPSPTATAPPCQDGGNVYAVRGNAHVCQKMPATPIATPATPLATSTITAGLPTMTVVPTRAPIPVLR